MGNTDPEAPPPSYDSIFGQLQAQKSQSDGVVDYTKKTAVVCCGKVAGAACLAVGIILFLALGLALPIAEIAIGSMYLDDCPAQRYLTIYLIVMGVFSIVSGCTGGGSRAAKRREGETEGENEEESKGTLGGCCNSLIGLFLTAWFICGNVWIFKMEECTEAEAATSMSCFTRNVTFQDKHNYCKDLVYEFVYWETIAKWALVGVCFVVGCLCCCFICCAYCCGSKSEEEE